MYEPYNETFTISDEETQLLTPSLAADFAEVTLVTGDEAEIYVNGDLKAKHSWTGRLASGSYIFESRQQGHVPYKMSYDISDKDQSKTIQIQSPTPIYGSLAVSSTPSKAKITLDGKSVGETPKYIARQVIGKYTVTAEMEGYEKQTKTVEVVEGTEASLAFVLEKEVVKVEEPQVASSDAYIDKVIMTFLNEKGGSYTFSKKGTAFGSDGKTYFKVSAVNDNQIAVSVYGQTNASSFSNNSLTMILENGRATASNDALRSCRYNRFNVEFTLDGSELTISASYTTSSYASFSIEHTVLLDFLSMAQANITSETISGDFVHIGEYVPDLDGIVFYLDSSGKHGKVISVKKTYNKYYTSSSAAQWLKSNLSGDWSMPSIDELYALYTHQKEINRTFLQITGRNYVLIDNYSIFLTDNDFFIAIGDVWRFKTTGELRKQSKGDVIAVKDF